MRVKPGARRTAIGGQWPGPYGPALIVAVTAQAVDDQANQAVCVALATTFGARRGNVTVVAGQRSRDKIVEVVEPREVE